MFSYIRMIAWLLPLENMHRDTITGVFRFQDNHDVDNNPIVCFCLLIFRDMHIIVWINAIGLQNTNSNRSCHKKSYFVESTLGDHTDTTNNYWK